MIRTQFFTLSLILSGFPVVFLPVRAAEAQVVHLLVSGEPPVEPGGIYANVDSGDRFVFSATGRRSYCCTIHADQDRSARLDSVTINQGSPLSVTAAGLSEPLLFNAEARVCFPVPGNDVSQAEISLTARFGAEGTSSAANVRTFCEETTLHGSFNTSVSDFNFLEISSTLHRGQVISGAVVLSDVVNNIAVLREFTLPVGGRVDLAVHDLLGARGFGPIKLWHNGPPGAIKSVLMQYKIITPAPLDFQPVAHQTLEPRSQLR